MKRKDMIYAYSEHYYSEGNDFPPLNRMFIWMLEQARIEYICNCIRCSY